ncbi:MAG: energy-coupling factor transporter ATPase [Bacillota bacterium]
MEKIIETIDLTFVYRAGSEKEVRALQNINMAVYKGEILAITGQNGSGKSTLARHFNGLLTPTVGRVLVKGYPTNNKDNIGEIRKLVGMVFQNPDNQLVSSIVEEDIAFGPENLGLPQAEIIERVDWALDNLNLNKLRREAPHNLSAGQKQRVAIAGVLAMRPECIILDEPTAHLDPRGRREVLESALRLNREEGITLVLLTHFMNEVIHCNRMLIMDSGTVKVEGSPRKIFQSDDGQSEEIMKMGLDFPVASRLASGLKQEGLNLPPDIIHSEELVSSLCQLKSKI